MNKKSQEILNKLQVMIVMADVKLAEDPKPVLQDAYEELNKAKQCIESIHYALSPAVVFDLAEELDLRPTDINGEAYIRCQKAKDVLTQYLHKE